MAVEREGEGQENGGKRQGKSPKTLHKQKGRIVHYDALSYIKAPAFGSRGFVIKKEGVPLDTPTNRKLIASLFEQACVVIEPLFNTWINTSTAIKF